MMRNKIKPILATAIPLTILTVIISFITHVWGGEPKVENVSGKYTKETRDQRAQLEVRGAPG